jgi:hypothetical protein
MKNSDSPFGIIYVLCYWPMHKVLIYTLWAHVTLILFIHGADPIAEVKLLSLSALIS